MRALALALRRPELEAGIKQRREHQRFKFCRYKLDALDREDAQVGLRVHAYPAPMPGHTRPAYPAGMPPYPALAHG